MTHDDTSDQSQIKSAKSALNNGSGNHKSNLRNLRNLRENIRHSLLASFTISYLLICIHKKND